MELQIVVMRSQQTGQLEQNYKQAYELRASGRGLRLRTDQQAVDQIDWVREKSTSFAGGGSPGVDWDKWQPNTTRSGILYVTNIICK
jgi:hypothetical protein